MRDINAVLKDTFEQLHDYGLSQTQAEKLCTTELGLYLQEVVRGTVPAIEACLLFSGFPLAQAAGLPISLRHEHMLRVGRFSLWSYRRQADWAENLQRYREFDRAVRGYELSDDDSPAVRRQALSTDKRWRAYASLLNEAPPFAGRGIPLAEPGPHRFLAGRSMINVTIPETPRPPEPTGHDLDALPPGGGAPLSFTLDQLLVTARAMDVADHAEGLEQRWVERLEGLRLYADDGTGLVRGRTFTVDRIQHLLGIVGAGKSTIRDVVAVHMVNERKGRVTIVVGDVAETLKLVAAYNRYTKGKAAPVLGISSRELHTQRMHRRLIGRGRHNLLAHDDPAFTHLSTSCVFNALIGEDGPLGFGEAPCTRLQPRTRQPDTGKPPSWAHLQRVACPFWSACPRHHSARALVHADIWVATPQSLLDSSVPWPLNSERVRYLEVACRRSDLIVIDEADRVQMQLDRIFAPAVSLVGGLGTTSFLDDINQHKIRQLVEGNREQLSDRDVENWSAALNTVTSATDRLYARLVSDPSLRAWIRTGYFSAWTLHRELLDERYPLPDEEAQDPMNRSEEEVRSDMKARTDLDLRLREFRENPFGDRSPARPAHPQLTELLGELLHTSYQPSTRKRVTDFFSAMFDLGPLFARKVVEYEAAKKAEKDKPKRRRKPPQTPKEWLEQTVRRFEFSLLVSGLEPKLALVNGMWPRVASALNLGFNDMYRRPIDYGPMVPESPMGNLLGFQFLVRGRDDRTVLSGELKFFRCGGVGRELLRAMPGLPTLDGRPGTNVLLMSGSSWAGLSSRYHIPVPVGVVIKPTSSQMRRMRKRTRLRFEMVREGGGDALQVSGKRLDQRISTLCKMATALASPGDEEEPSVFERELLALPRDRRHLLVLVGSYEEAQEVADSLHVLSGRWKGRVVCLISDDDAAEVVVDHENGDEFHAPVLRRGDVDSLARTRAQILVAPLLAVERGHNILNESGAAAIGSVFFLARPNPRPDDIGLAVHAINDWATRARQDGRFEEWLGSGESLQDGADRFRREARSEWYRLLARSLAWSRLGDDRATVTWDMLVLVWQVVGRLLRGGVPARIALVDGAFVPHLALSQPHADTPESSLAHSMREVLDPYFVHTQADNEATPSPTHRHIVSGLYGPLWQSLNRCLPRQRNDVA